MTQPQSTNAVLSYATAEPRGRANLVRAVLWLCALAAVGILSWKFARELSHRLEWLRLQRAVLHSLPSSGSIYESTFTIDPTRNKWPTARFGWDDTWVRYRQTLQVGSRTDSATLYAHSIWDSHGNELLVSVEMPCVITGDGSQPLEIHVLTPGTFFTAPRPAEIGVVAFQFDSNWLSAEHPEMEIYPGRPDPANPSRFTIDYDLNGQRHTLDGYLDDQDVLTIQKRKEPQP